MKNTRELQTLLLILDVNEIDFEVGRHEVYAEAPEDVLSEILPSCWTAYEDYDWYENTGESCSYIYKI